jgi:glycerol-3-phosphate dehydrogenase
VPREHEIRDHAVKDGVRGVVSMVGGKLTAYRGIAQEATDLVAERLGVRARCLTKTRALPGAVDVEALVASLGVDAARLGLAHDQLQRLASVYGAMTHELLARIAHDRSLARRLAPDSAATRVEVVHAVAAEDAATLADVLLRRTCLGLARDRALPVAQAAAEVLGWGRAEVSAYAEEVRAQQPLPERASA